MVKTLYLIRHGQGAHNISEAQPQHQQQGNSFVKDPHLTPTGKVQCLDLRQSFSFHKDVDIVMASPLCRTVQTAVLGLRGVLQRKEVPFLLVPQAQEISDKPCDTGTDAADLKGALAEIFEEEEYGFDAGRIDFSLLEEGWNSKKGEYEASLEAVQKRAAALRCWLWKRPEENIALVTHGAFLHYLTEDWRGLVVPRGTAWKTCEFRRFTFDEGSNEDAAHMTEVGEEGRDKGVRPVGAHSHDITSTEPLPN
ncbi:putative phosphatase SPAC5H10.03 [Lachnellula cervina]|uniref:Putative phosphatase SPAC5H10.03 n=1 Tax=Lachnellula cervina TaxID=1316786 RepID=A0A7D8UU22_9HELO|nr:putative phosphatase SPAC5H10.03 [Lachnellula cervina]